MSIFRIFGGRASGPAPLESQNPAPGVPMVRRGFEGLRQSMTDALAGFGAGKAVHAAERRTQESTQSIRTLTQQPEFHNGYRLDVSGNGGKLGGQGSPVPHGAAAARSAAFMADRTGGTAGFAQPAQTGRKIPVTPSVRIPRSLP